MIAPWDEVRIRGTRYRVEGFQTVDDALWVELEESGGGWPTKTAMITFAELAPLVMAGEEAAAREAYEERERDRRGIPVFGMSSEPPAPLPDGFWDGYKGPHDVTTLVLTVPPEKLNAVLEALR